MPSGLFAKHHTPLLIHLKNKDPTYPYRLYVYVESLDSPLGDTPPAVDGRDELCADCTGLLYSRLCVLFKVYYIVGLLVLNKNHILYGLLFEWFLWGNEFRCVAVLYLFFFFGYT